MRNSRGHSRYTTTVLLQINRGFAVDSDLSGAPITLTTIWIRLTFQRSLLSRRLRRRFRSGLRVRGRR